MRICLLAGDPGHPVLAATTALLAAEHEVQWLDPAVTAPGAALPPADVCLLKSHTPAAFRLARALEERGVPVLNSVAATERCQDRTVMAELARSAGLPFAATRTLPALDQLFFDGAPLVVKSRHSRRGDLVARVDDAGALAQLRRRWADEPVVVQHYQPNDGWDHKLWAVGDQVFAARRRSELDPAAGPGKDTRTVALTDLPPGWPELVRRVGEVFSLDVYGVDILDVAGAPVMVDVNAFPGIRGQAGAPEALAALALRTAALAAT
ncbi:hypothetical protein GCM10010218_59010 [Streptomyces mashuensis]|uniref:ATP-grasp fold RimK-type domain-containing protein n=1 Tax=Streptomyces mashuensis TaxID=33904 RepID=A0A919EG93_9ACTN|nr:alpha-L-glutamate ligase [Streptomyces mashuensis]GHF69882.1 hypothetical protein GCM10010218_59010 [Streptomyces mashuensis]